MLFPAERSNQRNHLQCHSWSVAITCYAMASVREPCEGSRHFIENGYKLIKTKLFPHFYRLDILGYAMDTFKVIGIRPMAPVLDTGVLEGIWARHVKFFGEERNYYKWWQFGSYFIVQSSRRGIPSDFIAVESSYCHYLDMLKLQTNKRNDVYIIFARCDTRKLLASLQSFKRKL